MKIGNEIIEFLSNKAILVTGATGFLAKVLVEKILRVQPNVKQLYLLIRVRNNKSATERLNQIMGMDLFQALRKRQASEFDSFISKRVTPVRGDTSLSNLGLKADDEIHKKIDVIIHAAALTRFYERYDTALAVNTLGAKNVMDFAKNCPNLQILVHVSTAYVTRQKSGLIPETLCHKTSQIVGLDLDAEKKLIDEKMNALTRKEVSTKEIRDSMRRLGRKRAISYGWPNVYTFTKAMGEMLIEEHKGDLPVVIVRPTMICSSYKEPFPGWIEGVGSINMLSILYGKGLMDFTLGDSNAVFDLIPVDMVTNSMVKAMVANANKPGLTIYHVGSSMKNPITMSKVVDLNFQYFNKNPWIDGKGTIIRIRKGKIVKSKLQFVMRMLKHVPKLMVVKLVEKASCHSKLKQDPLEMQLKVTAKMAMFYKHYTFFAGIFDDTNTEKLRTIMSKHMDGEEGYNFDPKDIDWEDYLLNNLIPSTVKYLF